MSTIAQGFYKGKTVNIAKNLLGKILIREFESGEVKKGLIVETEAYLGPKDLACHSSSGRTKRTEVMFGPAGQAYVYLVYGIYYMFNIVTEAPGEAVLVRALEPFIKAAGDSSKPGFKDRSQSPAFSSPVGVRIAAGPGKLTKWMEIDKSFNGWDLTTGEKLWVESGFRKDLEIARAERVGVDYAGDWAEKPFRFYIEGNPAVSVN